MPQLTLDGRVVVIDTSILRSFASSDRCVHGSDGNCGSCIEEDVVCRDPYFSRDQVYDWGVDFGGNRYWYAEELWNDPGRYRIHGIPRSRKEYFDYVSNPPGY